MTAFNSISLISDQLKFTAKYPACDKKSADNPLKGYFNYIHMVHLHQAAASNPENTPAFLNKAIEQFHQQGLAAVKIKLISNKVSQQTESSKHQEFEVIKFTRPLSQVAINHGNFRADQIVKEDGNTCESLSYVVRIRSGNINSTQHKEIHDKLLNDSSPIVEEIEKGIREAVGNGQALEVAIQNVEAVLLPQLARHLEGNFDLKIKLKRQELFSNTRVVVSSSTYPAQNRGLSKNDQTRTWEGTHSAPSRYTSLPPTNEAKQNA